MSHPIFQFEQNRPIDIICMGRVAVDLYAEQIGQPLADAETFRKYLGGCAGNIAVGTSRLGLNSMMFSCVGQDDMGLFLKNTLVNEGVKIDLVYESKDHLTGLVLLGVKPPHDFPLIFYRRECADMQLKPGHASESHIEQSKGILITGTALSTVSMRGTTHYVVNLAKKLHTAVVFDLDYRPVLWGLTSAGNGETRYIDNMDVSKAYQEIMPFCDLIVGTEEEICIAGGSQDIESALKVIQSLSSAPIVVKSGEQGCRVYAPNLQEPLQSKPFPVEVLNCLGAGDAFMAGLLRGLFRGESFETATSYANACGALVVTRHGCAPATPWWNELDYFINAFDNNPSVWKSPELARLHNQGTALITKNDLVIKRPYGFQDGLNPLVTMANSTMNFSSLKLRAGQAFEFSTDLEFAAVLMTGRVKFHYAGKEVQAERSDYFSQNPIVLHCSADTKAQVIALSDCELLLIETANNISFDPILFNESNMLELDHRGDSLLENTSARIVRTVFDKRNRKDSNLVVGEIITPQGRWSSYPSHYHSQPEIYHYRFSEPQGFAFGENGKDVLRIEHNDTYHIDRGQEHAHCTAPGYALYTLWFIRHQENNPYISPTFRPEHEWTRYEHANLRAWKE